MGSTYAAFGGARAAQAAAAVPNLTSYGHSFAMDNYPYIPDPRYGEYARIMGRSLSSTVSLRARSGTRLLDTVIGLTAPSWAGGTARLWTPHPVNLRSAVLLHNVHNDCSSVLGGLPAYQNGYRLALELALAVLSAGHFVPAAQHTYVTRSAWHTHPTPYVRDGELAWTSTPRAKISFEVSGDECHVATLATADQLPSGTLRAEVGGKVLGYFAGHGRMAKYTDSVDDKTVHRWSNAGWRISGMNAAAATPGTKQLTLRKVDDTSAPVWVNGVYTPATLAPNVYVALEPPRNPAATYHQGVLAFERNNPTYRKIITTACARFANATVVDLAPGWDNASMVADTDPYKFHPNDAGMQHIARRFLEFVRFAGV